MPVIIYREGKIIGTATDEYSGPDQYIPMPEGFNIDEMGKYRVIDGEVIESVPQTVSRAQGKAALIQAGLWSLVVGFVESIEDETERLLAETALYDTQTWERDSPFLNAAAASLSITAAQMDNLFMAAAAIKL